MENKIITKKIEIDGINFNIYKTIPQSPIDMYNFLMKYLKSPSSNLINPDFKHIFDYVESIKEDNKYYLLSLLNIPPCPIGTNSLGNFFGQKMNNVSKDLNIFPFGNTIILHNSLVSKRTGKHPAYILLSIKGNKLLNNIHPSCPNNKTIGNFIVDKWSNNILKRYENYLFTFGLQICVEEEYLKFLNKNKTIQTSTKDILEDKTIQTSTKDILEDDIEQSILNIINQLNNKEILLNNINISNINYINSVENNILYYKYQNEIINLKRLIFYLIKNNGKLLNDIDTDFSENFLKNIFGSNFKVLIKF